MVMPRWARAHLRKIWPELRERAKRLHDPTHPFARSGYAAYNKQIRIYRASFQVQPGRAKQISSRSPRKMVATALHDHGFPLQAIGGHVGINGRTALKYIYTSSAARAQVASALKLAFGANSKKPRTGRVGGAVRKRR